jgi:hypothetical protein
VASNRAGAELVNWFRNRSAATTPIDRSNIPADNNAMNVTEKNLISPELLAELEEVLRNPYAAPDPETMAKAYKQINRMREETRKKLGELDVAVELVRDARK